jgi:hypothetical protein
MEFSMQFHEKFHGIPWNFSMEFSMEFHILTERFSPGWAYPVYRYMARLKFVGKLQM